MRTPFLTVAVVLAIAGPSAAADLTITVKGDDGMALADAVVVVKPAGGAAAAPIKFSWPLVMSQQNIAFNPYVLIVPVGSEVAFPNKDKVRHHVYSFSAAKRFELKLYGQQAERTVVFDKAGIVRWAVHNAMLPPMQSKQSTPTCRLRSEGHRLPRTLSLAFDWRGHSNSCGSGVCRLVRLARGSKKC